MAEFVSEIGTSASSRRKRRIPVKRTLAVKERTTPKERPPPKEHHLSKEHQPSKERLPTKERPVVKDRPSPKERLQIKDTIQRKGVLKVKSEKREKQKEKEKDKEEDKETVKEVEKEVEEKAGEEQEKTVEAMIKCERKRPGRKKKEREPKPMIIKPPRPKAVLEGYPWQCTDCTVVLSTLQELRTHHQMEHNQLPNFKCIQCAKVYTRYRSFARHVKLHRNPKKFR